jgi:pimeloyl-ACP methyl ester carboxylesterase
MPHAAADDGVRLYYEEGSGAPIVFVNEFAGDHRSWERQMRFFLHRYRCIAFNARGYPPAHPPATRSDRITALLRTAAKKKYGDESRTEDVLRDGAFGRVIEPEQVAETVAFLASPRASHLSGVVLNLGT